MRRAYIFGAGERDRELPRLEDGDLVIAADGGYDWLSDAGTAPDVVIGDFDSLSRDPDSPDVLRYPVRKDDTDMALAISCALERGAEEIVICGGLGGRLDHTFANIQLLAGLSRRGTAAYLRSDSVTVTAITDGSLTFDKAFTGVISVFAYGGDATVTERGLSYSVEDCVLRDDRPMGISNEFTGVEARISVRGTAIVMWQWRGEPCASRN